MIGVDSNVLLRAVTNDDRNQSPIARRLIAGLNEAAPGYVNTVVLCEFAWTLDRHHGYARSAIAVAIERLMESRAFVVADRDAVSRALVRCIDDELDFPDALLCELNLGAGCRTTVTFDRKAARQTGFAPAN